VEHVFGDVIGELDPGYIDPYWLGALILSTEAQDLDAGLRLLDRGFEKNPSAWILPFLAGWECDRVGQFDRAATYFDRAARAPGAPPDLFRLKAGMTARTGNLREAIARWQDVLDDPRNDAGARGPTRQIRTLRVRADVHDLMRRSPSTGKLGRLPGASTIWSAPGSCARFPGSRRDAPTTRRKGKCPATRRRCLGS
jgi:tetratricopeptide (TPR) repeat protein